MVPEDEKEEPTQKPEGDEEMNTGQDDALEATPFARVFGRLNYCETSATRRRLRPLWDPGRASWTCKKDACIHGGSTHIVRHAAWLIPRLNLCFAHLPEVGNGYGNLAPKLADKWKSAVWLGKSDLADEHLVRTNEGVENARSAGRLAERSWGGRKPSSRCRNTTETEVDNPAAGPLAPPPAAQEVPEDEKEEHLVYGGGPVIMSRLNEAVVTDDLGNLSNMEGTGPWFRDCYEERRGAQSGVFWFFRSSSGMLFFF